MASSSSSSSSALNNNNNKSPNKIIDFEQQDSIEIIDEEEDATTKGCGESKGEVMSSSLATSSTSLISSSTLTQSERSDANNNNINPDSPKQPRSPLERKLAAAALKEKEGLGVGEAASSSSLPSSQKTNDEKGLDALLNNTTSPAAAPQSANSPNNSNTTTNTTNTATSTEERPPRRPSISRDPSLRNSKNNRRPSMSGVRMSSFKEEELNDSMILSDVFMETERIRSVNTSNNNNNNSSSGESNSMGNNTSNNPITKLLSRSNSSSRSSTNNNTTKNTTPSTTNNPPSSSTNNNNNLPNPTSNTTTTTTNNHNSISSSTSSFGNDISSSWGSNAFDTKQISLNFEDILRVDEGHRISGQPIIMSSRQQQQQQQGVGGNYGHGKIGGDGKFRESNSTTQSNSYPMSGGSGGGGGSGGSGNEGSRGGGGDDIIRQVGVVGGVLDVSSKLELSESSKLSESFTSTTPSGSYRSGGGGGGIASSSRSSSKSTGKKNKLKGRNKLLRKGSGSSEESSNRTGSQGPSLHHLSEDIIVDVDDDGGGGMIPPVFKTIRRNSNSNLQQQQVVHVDGGGDGRDLSRNLGYTKNTTSTSYSTKSRGGGVVGILKNSTFMSGGSSAAAASFRRRGTLDSTTSSKSNSSTMSGRFRRSSNASNSSDNMTGLQVLAASFQSARQRNQSNTPSPSHPYGGYNNHLNNSVTSTSSMNDPSDGGTSGYDQYSTGEYNNNRPNKFEQRGNTVPISSIPGSSLSRVRSDYQMQSIRSLRQVMSTRNAGGDNNNNDPDHNESSPTLLDGSINRSGHPLRRSNSSLRSGGSVGSGMDLSDSRRDATAMMDDSDLERKNENGDSGSDNDTKLVAEVGGTAYLRASRSVWCMRIIVVMTFIVVAAVVTILTYTFFRDMESDVQQNNYMGTTTVVITDISRSIDDKSASARAFSKMYSGILGTEQGDNVLRTANHPPSCMASQQTLDCAADEKFNWMNSWPNVTLPGFDSIGSAMLGVSHSRAAVFAPLLMNDEVGWQKYAADTALPPVKGVVSGGIRTSPSSTARDLQEDDTFTTTSKFSAPAWQIAPAELSGGGIMWDYNTHPPYKEPIDRILNWNKDGDNGEGLPHDHGHGRSMLTHDMMAAMGQPSGFATELMSCSDTLLPLELNPVPHDDPIVLSAHDELHSNEEEEEEIHNQHDAQAEETGDACTAIFHPVYAASPFGGSNYESKVSGVVAEVFSWADLLSASMNGQYGIHEVRAVLESTLKLPDGTHRTKAATYLVTDNIATFLQSGRATESQHEDMMVSYEFEFPHDTAITYSIELYPTDNVCYNNAVTKKPMYLAIIAACFFILSVLVFFVYDYFVNYRQKVVVRSAARSTRIINSLYPQFVRDSLLSSERRDSDHGVGADVVNRNSAEEYDEEDPQRPMESSSMSYRKKGLKSKVSDFVDTPGMQLKRFLSHPTSSRDYDYNLCMEIGDMEPIAEVFENTTIMLADIDGFTAWCSEREPSQVFRLLETVYREFDIEARKLGVFKVETVGDCYVAATGLPDPRDDHAIVIAKYAVRCLLKFNVLTKRLEANLGPGTASLGMRFGLHSGPVTAGVLRGEKSRFQLFGDTINVASRMESTGEKNMIQVSQTTADLLNASGKGHWLKPREGPVSAKGKGAICTYWLQPNRRRSASTASFTPSLRESMNDPGQSSEKESVPSVSLDRALRQSWKCIGIDSDSLVAKERLIRWNAAIFESYLLKIVDNRNGDSNFLEQFIPSPEDKKLSFSEKLSEKIMFPHTAYRDDYYGVSTDIAISSEAQIELLEYVARIASMYRDVPFHNFDHASHVTMSANKLLNRVCTTFEDEEEDIASVAARTFGISADPLAQFVVVFSSLVHDVDHQGVPNAQLVKEDDPLASEFDNNRSIAEKHSITIAWEILMEDRFRELQQLIFINGDEMVRFKQLLVNTVLATDIADKERSAIGKTRWQKAFHPSTSGMDLSTNSLLDDVNLRSLKATLVFEQIMQASDVAHTMQHWETFKKWNKRLYSELSKGLRDGRGSFDPRDNWYGGEIGFFDFYIIPLAKKLKECGVFGSAASEYLDYALENRRRWEEEGQEIARIMIADNDRLVAEELAKQEEKEAAKEEEKKDAKDASTEQSSTEQSSPEACMDGEKSPS